MVFHGSGGLASASSAEAFKKGQDQPDLDPAKWAHGAQRQARLSPAVIVVDHKDGVALQDVLGDQKRPQHVGCYAPTAVPNDL